MIDGKLAIGTELTVNASLQAETSIGAPTFLSRPEPKTVAEGKVKKKFMHKIFVFSLD
jgi:hypothetical protein